MSRLALALGLFAVWFIVGCAAAFAQTAVAPVTTVAVLPFYQIVEPYILTAFGIVFSALTAWAIAVFQKKTGIQVNADARSQFQNAAMNAAGRILAAQEGNLANVSVNVHSAVVANEAKTVAGLIPGALNTLGINPDVESDVLAHAIAGKVGVLQAQVPQVSASIAGAAS